MLTDIMKSSGMLFYTDIDKKVRSEDAGDLTRLLVEFATEYDLSGNIWQKWIAYQIMTEINTFSMACERRPVVPEATLIQLAGDDMSRLRNMLYMEHAGCMTDYTAPYGDTDMGPAGKHICAFAEKLLAAKTDDEFCAAVIDEYEKYGTGMFGLYNAFRIDPSRQDDGSVNLVPVTDFADVSLDDLIGYESQKQVLKENTEAFVSGKFANNVLLYGDSGTGKSTSVHALVHEYAGRGLRLIEVSKADRGRIPQILSQIKKRNYRFIIYLDDLSFEEDESDYKELKAMLEGALEARSDRVIIYATSNRRHLIRETWRDRSDMEFNEDVHRSDTMEEKLSLAARFGVSIYYPKPDPKQYLEIVRTLAEKKGLSLSGKDLDDTARKWELRHGGMTGRTASQLITWLGGAETKRENRE